MTGLPSAPCVHSMPLPLVASSRIVSPRLRRAGEAASARGDFAVRGASASLAGVAGVAAAVLRRATRLRLRAHVAGAPVQWAGAKTAKVATPSGAGEVDTKEHALQLYCPMKLGKRGVPPELDLLGQIMGADPGLPARLNLTQEQMAYRFTTIRDLLIEELGCSEAAAGVCVALAARGKDMQNAGKPRIPAPKRVRAALAWVEANSQASREDGSLRATVEKYPFMIAKSVEEFEENKEMCPEQIEYESAVVFRPRVVDKVFQCGGKCKGRCGSCWFG